MESNLDASDPRFSEVDEYFADAEEPKGEQERRCTRCSTAGACSCFQSIRPPASGSDGGVPDSATPDHSRLSDVIWCSLSTSNLSVQAPGWSVDQSA